MSQIPHSLTDLSPEVLALLGSTPLMPPAEGVTSDFVHPHSRGSIQMIVTSVVLGIMLLFFINRVYVKVVLMKKITWDDGTLTLGVFGCIAYYVACVWGAQKGYMGIHGWDISILQASSLDLLIPGYILTVLTPLNFLFIKTTFFILYLQVFNQLRWLRNCSWLGLAATTITYTILTIVAFIFSTPRHGQSWFEHRASEGEGNNNITPWLVPQSVIGLILDVYILVLPMAGVSSLRMSPRRKFGVMSMFFSGVMACICSTCSIYYRDALARSLDMTWNLIPMNTLTLCEMLVGVICACMPAAAYIARHEDSMYRKLLTIVTIPFESFRSTLRESKNSSISSRMRTRPTHKGDEENPLKSTDRKYARYFNIDVLASGSTDTQNTGSMTTVTGSPHGRVAEVKGIQRQIDIDIEGS